MAKLQLQLSKHNFKKAKVLLFLDNEPMEICTEVQHSDVIEDLQQQLLNEKL